MINLKIKDIQSLCISIHKKIDKKLTISKYFCYTLKIWFRVYKFNSEMYIVQIITKKQ